MTTAVPVKLVPPAGGAKIVVENGRATGVETPTTVF